MSILPPSHLDYLYLGKPTHNLSHHLQVLLHSGISSFKTALYLTNQQLGIQVNLHSRAPISITALNPASKASYLVSLLEALKPNLKECFGLIRSRVMIVPVLSAPE